MCENDKRRSWNSKQDLRRHEYYFKENRKTKETCSLRCGFQKDYFAVQRLDWDEQRFIHTEMNKIRFLALKKLKVQRGKRQQQAVKCRTKGVMSEARIIRECTQPGLDSSACMVDGLQMVKVPKSLNVHLPSHRGSLDPSLFLGTLRAGFEQ